MEAGKILALVEWVGRAKLSKSMLLGARAGLMLGMGCTGVGCPKGLLEKESKGGWWLRDRCGSLMDCGALAYIVGGGSF